MKAVEFNECNIEIAKKQKEYKTLPAFWNTPEASITFCMELDQEEIDWIQKTGKIWIKQLTFGNPMQPMNVSVFKDNLITKK